MDEITYRFANHEEIIHDGFERVDHCVIIGIANNLVYFADAAFCSHFNLALSYVAPATGTTPPAFENDIPHIKNSLVVVDKAGCFSVYRENDAGVRDHASKTRTNNQWRST